MRNQYFRLSAERQSRWKTRRQSNRFARRHLNQSQRLSALHHEGAIRGAGDLKFHPKTHPAPLHHAALHEQHVAEAGRAFFLATPADRYVLALHDWVNRFGAEPFPGQPLPARLELGWQGEPPLGHGAGAQAQLRQLD